MDSEDDGWGAISVSWGVGGAGSSGAGVADALESDGQRVILSADFASADLAERYPTLSNLADPPADFAAAFSGGRLLGRA